MNYTQLLEQVKQHVIHFFKTKGDQKFAYHNLSHTEAVVSNAAKIASHYQLGEKDIFIVMTAAWFHDSGYFKERQDRATGRVAGKLARRSGTCRSGI